MARGGARPSAGRPRGRGNETTRKLLEIINARPGTPLEEVLAEIAEDAAVAREVRLCACRHLAGWLAGRVVRITGLEILE